MKCPNCGHELHSNTYKNLQVEECTNCHGMWLDFRELDELEDEEWNQDEMKGTVVYKSTPSERKCPKCGKQMKAFAYRLHDELQMEYCPDNHGFWLDNGEGEEVLTLIRQEEKANERQEKAESDWILHLWRLQNPSFFQRMLSYLPGMKGEDITTKEVS